jgi:hypothetical protein
VAVVQDTEIDEDVMAGYPFIQLNNKDLANPSTLNFTDGLTVELLRDKVNIRTTTPAVTGDIADVAPYPGASVLVESGTTEATREYTPMVYSETDSKWVGPTQRLTGYGGMQASDHVTSGYQSFVNQQSSTAVGIAATHQHNWEVFDTSGLAPMYRMYMYIQRDIGSGPEVDGQLLVAAGDDDGDLAADTDSVTMCACNCDLSGSGTKSIMFMSDWEVLTGLNVENIILITPQFDADLNNGQTWSYDIDMRWVSK